MSTFYKIALIAITNLLISGCYTDFKQKTKTNTPGGVISQLGWIGSTSVPVNACVAFEVQLQDSVGLAGTSDVLTNVQLSHSSSGNFYLDSACTISIVGTSIAAHSSSVTIYYKNSVAQTELIQAIDTAGSLNSASASLVVGGSSGGATKVTLSGPSSISAGQCREFYVQAQNVSGTPTLLSALVQVILTGKGAGNFYSDGACTNVTSSVSIPAGFHTVLFYFKDNTPQSLTFSASDSSGVLNGSSLMVSVDGSSQLDFTGPLALYLNQCGQYSIQSLNGTGIVTPVTTDSMISLSASGGSFYSDSSCSTGISQKTLTAGNSQVFVYFKKGTLGGATLTASSAGLGSDSLSVALSGGNQIVMTGSGALYSGICALYTLTAKDGGVDTAVLSPLSISLSGAGNGNFYSNASCSIPVSSATITTGNSQVQFYYRANAAQNVTLRGTAPVASPFGFAELAVSISGAKALSLLGSSPIYKDTCTAYTVQARDIGGSPAAVPFNVNVTLGNTGSGMIYSNESCSSAISQIMIPAGSSSATFYFESSQTGANVLSVSDSAGNLTNSSLIVDVTQQLATLVLSDSPSYDFGDVMVGDTITKTFTLTNSGLASATSIEESPTAPLTTPFDFVGGNYPGTGGTCGSSLSAGLSCTIKVKFSPTTVGNFFDDVVLKYNDGGTETTVSRHLVASSSANVNGGLLDTTFSSDGIRVHDLGGPGELLQAVTIQQPDGKILVAGSAENPNFQDWDFVLVRYLSNGNVDTSFGSNGVVFTDFRGGDDFCYAMALQADGKIVAVGSSRNTSGGNQSIALARYSANGTPDSSFGTSGKIVRRVGSTDNVDVLNAVRIDSSGRIVAAGRTDNSMLFARYTSGGNLDTTFGGSSGTGLLKFAVTTGSNSALGMVLQSDGKILVTGYASNIGFTNSGILTVRLTTSGALDTSFNGVGYVSTPIGSAISMGRGIALDNSGKIVVVGATSNSVGAYNIALVRYTSSGALDGSFDADGKKVTSLGSDPSLAEKVAIQSDNKIVIAGYQWGSEDKFIVARYNTDGFLDTTFSTDGVVSVTGGRAHNLVIQSDGKIVAVGQSAERLAIIRVLP